MSIISNALDDSFSYAMLFVLVGTIMLLQNLCLMAANMNTTDDRAISKTNI